MMDEKKNNPHSQYNATSSPDPEHLREQAEQKAKDMPLPDLDTMSREEIRQRFHELHAKQIEAELKNEQLRSQLEEKDDHAALFKIVTEDMLDMVTLTDMEGNFTFAGKAHEILGYEPGFLIGKNVMDFVHPEDLPRIVAEFDASIASVQPRKVEYRYRCEDGSYLWFETVGNFIKDENGVPQKIIFNSRDITERKRTKHKLRESEEKYRFMTEQMNDVVWTSDLEMRVTYISPSDERILGFTPEERAKHTLVDMLTPSSQEKAIEAISKEYALEETGHADFSRSITVELEYRHKDGSTRWLETLAKGIRDDKGLLTGFHGVSRDITERKHTWAALIASEEKHRRLFETMAQGVIYQDVNGKIISANPAAERILGLSFDQMKGKTSMDPRWKMIKEDGTEVPGTDHPIMIALRTGETVGPVIRGVFHHDRNTYVWLSIAAIPLFQPGETEPFQAYAMFEDVTERKQATEELKEREAFIKATLDNLPVGVAINSVDPKVHFNYMNENFAAFYRTTKEALAEPNDFWEVVYTDATFREEIKKRVLEDCASNDPERMYWEDVPVSRPGKKPFYITAKNIPLPESNLVVSTVWDVTERKQAEQALAESETRFKALHNASFGGIAIHDQGIILECNQGLSEMMGYQYSELIGMDGLLLIAEKSREAVMNNIRTGYEKPYEAFGLRKNGEEFPMRLEARNVPYKGKQVRTVEFRDITESKRAEEQLRISEEKYRNIFENMQDVYYETSLDGLILEISPSIEAISNGQYRQADLIGRQMLDFYDDAEERDRLVTKLLETGSVSDVEISLRNRDGSLVPCSISAKLWRDDQGNPVKIIGSMRDITARKQAEAERERLITAIEQGDDVVIITDIDGLIQYANPAFETVTGYSRKEVLGQNPRIFKSGKQDEAFYREMWDTLTSGNTFHGRMINKRKDGSLYTEDATISPIRDAAGNIVSYVAVKRDVTAHIQLETQLIQAQKMESVGRLAGGVAHDYNNMLSVILGYTEMAMDQVDPKDQLYADLMEVYNAGKRSRDITAQLLAFARKQIISPVVMDLNETVDGMLKMLHRLIGEDIDFAWEPAIRLWPVNMDLSQLDQILANLCVNARDAISGVGKITIETENITLDESYCAEHAGFKPGDFVMLAVSDNGCGMDKETLEHIFEPFFTTKEVGKGTGLGLPMIYGIVKQNNGFINVYSEPGQGTTFRIYLPRHTIGTDEAVMEVTHEEVVFGQGETILLVEDEPAIIKMGQTMLKKLGYNVLIAHAPDEAVILASEYSGKIHILITDVVMPGMNGRDLADKLRAIRPDIRVLFMSGYTANVIVHHGVLDKGEHFIQKPFSMKRLSVKVREALEGGKSTQQ